jgi:hypothetical protein
MTLSGLRGAPARTVVNNIAMVSNRKRSRRQAYFIFTSSPRERAGYSSSLPRRLQHMSRRALPSSTTARATSIRWTRERIEI